MNTRKKHSCTKELHSHPHSHEHEHHVHDHFHDHAHEHHHHYNGSDGPILTVRAASGLSGDMMLAGLVSLSGLSTSIINDMVDELQIQVLKGCLTVEPKFVNQIAGVGCTIALPHEHTHRNLLDIRKLIHDSAMPEDAKILSDKAFTLLAEAEAAVHSKNVEEVTFHEVGALDSILDTCMVCRLFTHLKPARFICSPLPVADGSVFCAHGHIGTPAPAVLRMLEGVPVYGFSAYGETVTPTAIALLKALDAEFGVWPSMTVQKTVISYGKKVFENAPNGAIWALGTDQSRSK